MADQESRKPQEIEGETLSTAAGSAAKSPMIGGYRIIRQIGSGPRHRSSRRISMGCTCVPSQMR